MEPEGTSATSHEIKRKRRKRSAEEIVSGYQTRIVKAQQSGRFGLVKQLQKMLAYSQSGKLTAVERVTENKGSKWCMRRHPDKNKHWIAKKYFTRVPGATSSSRWVFHGEVEKADGETRLVYLRKASSVSIRRHIKIPADVNPYDPVWHDYIEQRHSSLEYRSIPAAGSTESMELPN